MTGSRDTPATPTASPSEPKADEPGLPSHAPVALLTPERSPVPEPDLLPAHERLPVPVPDLSPVPERSPVPVPDLSPVPERSPVPVPDLSPVPERSPVPVPDLSPDPEPAPELTPELAPEPVFEPDSEPTSLIVPEPAQVPVSAPASAPESSELDPDEDTELFGLPAPPVPRTFEETGLDEAFGLDLALKHIYFSGELEGLSLADAMALDFRVVEVLLEGLKRRELIVAAGGSGLMGGIRLRHRATERGRGRAEELLRRDNYLGPAPVPVDQYRAQVRRQAVRNHRVPPGRLAKVFSSLVLDPWVLDRLGPALSSGASIFLWGAAGNGKTSVAQCLVEALGGCAFVPRAIIVDRQVIRVFDPVYHRPLDPELDSEGPEVRHDGRWVLAERPAVMVGGELTLEMLDLTSPGTATWYEAPFQLKANSGMLFVDDFGRQRCDPVALLNRWIVPLESGFDFLTFRSGQKALVPFDNVTVFATNLEPASLVDEAFLRRIRYKIEIRDPSPEQYKQIWARVCASHGIPYAEELVDHLLRSSYRARDRSPRSCHPRDLLEQLVDIGRYLGKRPPLTKALLDQICETYFGP